jgi:hypothetical protein
MVRITLETLNYRYNSSRTLRREPQWPRLPAEQSRALRKLVKAVQRDNLLSRFCWAGT